MADPRDEQGLSLSALQRALSEPRLDAYRQHPSEPLRAAVGRYRWNMALSMALYPALHLLEVSLRNNLHREITKQCGTPAWYDITPSLLTFQEHESIAKAKAELQRQHKPEEPSRVVAELSFGFWTSLLSTNYEQKLWPRLLRAVFPYMPNRERTRKVAAGRFKDIRGLRNRISHHEPIHRLPNLMRLHDEIHDALGWLSWAPAHLLPVGEDFREVYARGSTPYEVPVHELGAPAPEG